MEYLDLVQTIIFNVNCRIQFFKFFNWNILRCYKDY